MLNVSKLCVMTGEKVACTAGVLLGRANVIGSRPFIRMATFELGMGEERGDLHSPTPPLIFHRRPPS